MTESQSRSGLDLPEGSANADKVDESGLVDTNADDARNEVEPEGQKSMDPNSDDDSSAQELAQQSQTDVKPAE